MDELKPITLAALAAITGIFGAVLILAISWLAGWPWVYAVLGLAAISAITWLVLMRRYLAIVGGDDPVTLQPSKVYPTTTRIEITAKDPSGVYQHGKFADLPVSPVGLIAVAKRIQAGASFSHAGLAGPGRPLSRAEFECLRDAMISRGLAHWLNPGSHSQGCELTLAGRRVMEYFCKHDDPVRLAHLPQLPTSVPMTQKLPSAAHAHTRTRAERKVIIDH